MKRKVTGLIAAFGLMTVVAGCDLQQVWYQLCPEPHVATAPTSVLIEELISRGLNVNSALDGD